MRRGIFAPCCVLAGLLALSQVHACYLARETERYLAPLNRAEILARERDWSGAAAALEESRSSWDGGRGYLHMFARHDVADRPGEFYRRAAVFLGEEREFLAALEEIRLSLEDLRERERLTAGNIL